jgi:O-antigen ligase
MQKEYIRYVVFAFLVSIGITEILSYLVWFEIVPPFKNAIVSNPTPFMSHISYNPILAFAIYLVSHEIFFNKALNKLQFFLYSFFAISMSINMFITGGRAGQVVFFWLIAILIFQFFNAEKIKSLIAILILIPGIFFTAYQSSDLFKERVDSAVRDIVNYEMGLKIKESRTSKDYEFDFRKHLNTPVGERISYAMYSWKIFTDSPIIGVGTGGFPLAYQKINAIYSPRMVTTDHPHNMYSLIAVQLGLVGLVSFLSIFYYQIKLSFQSPSRFIRDVGIALPLMFLLIMLSDSYLLGHYTTLMFVFFSSFLYKDFEKT